MFVCECSSFPSLFVRSFGIRRVWAFVICVWFHCEQFDAIFFSHPLFANILQWTVLQSDFLKYFLTSCVFDFPFASAVFVGVLSLLKSKFVYIHRFVFVCYVADRRQCVVFWATWWKYALCGLPYASPLQVRFCVDDLAEYLWPCYVWCVIEIIAIKTTVGLWYVGDK